MWQVKKLFTHAIYKEVTFNRPICKIRNIEWIYIYKKKLIYYMRYEEPLI